MDAAEGFAWLATLPEGGLEFKGGVFGIDQAVGRLPAVYDALAASVSTPNPDGTLDLRALREALVTTASEEAALLLPGEDVSERILEATPDDWDSLLGQAALLSLPSEVVADVLGLLNVTDAGVGMSSQSSGSPVSDDDFPKCVPRAWAGYAICTTYYASLAVAVLLLLVAILVVAIVILVAVLVTGLAIALAIFWANFIFGKLDENADGMGDVWFDRWYTNTGQLLEAPGDLDLDGLSNVDEFRWELVPACLPYGTYPLPDGVDHANNCKDYEQDPATGDGGDGFLDGLEVWYWNDLANDGASAPDVALYDPDRLLDSDGDGVRNVWDPDSDNDALLDGDEYHVYGTYPEFGDSDCSATAVECTRPKEDASPHHGARVGDPGTGDGLADAAEVAAWEAIVGPGSWSADADEDGIPNLLDPDSDNDGLLDGEEVLLGQNQVRPDLPDTDGDGLEDAEETAWHADTDGDGFVNANDPDSDDDGMPDLWEHEHGFNMVDPNDAGLDRDADGLTNLGEYLATTDPDDMDSEDDLLLDGEEVNVYGTDPWWWDTDADGMPDEFEAQHGLDPLDAADAALDPDGDSFDQDGDGVFELVWTSLDEYAYGRPDGYAEPTHGPWQGGTAPRDPDSDDDGGPDGFEVYWGTNPNFPIEANADPDGDGLNFTAEFARGTDPLDPDTDGDGLCDGGRAANCTWPGGGSTGFQPGEADYGSIPWDTDSDGDGIPDGLEAVRWDAGATGSARDVDLDGLNGVIDHDSDDDGLSDGNEVNLLSTDPAAADSDADGLTDGDEVLMYATLPLVVDTDEDGLGDGAEVDTHITDPLDEDTDGDGLEDGPEVNQHATNPLAADTDFDGLPDDWEVTMGTLAVVADADRDPDLDDLVNAEEYHLGTDPLDADSDGDGMPDAYEVTHDLGPTVANAAGDADWDGLTNLEEYERGTQPKDADTDDDGLSDGAEVETYATDPFTPDTDADGLTDAAEVTHWATVSSTAWSTNYDGDAIANNLLDADSDNDGLDDGDEVLAFRTRAHSQDTDGDGLTDPQETREPLNRRFSPTKYDTDGDGENDGDEYAKLTDPEADFDDDGLTNQDEDDVYSTDKENPDSDCDGWRDGPERDYWQTHGGWNTGSNRLLNPDVDGDSLKDGVEAGAAGTPRQAMYRTDPGRVDSDLDGLADDEEDTNRVRVECDDGSSSSSSSTQGMQAPAPVLGPSFPLVLVDDLVRQMLDPEAVYEDPLGAWYALDEAGDAYLLGGHGVRLYPEEDPEGLPWDWPLLPSLPGTTMSSSSSSGPPASTNTNPTRWDTDGDGLSDGEEVLGSANPYSDRFNSNGPDGNTDPRDCDSDKDGLSDGLELGRRGASRSDTPLVCRQADADPATKSNPNVRDTDGDGRWDDEEDPNADGRVNVRFDGYSGAQTTPTNGGIDRESNPLDGDTDDDGICDLDELLGDLNALSWDTDGDGLSDGLETGVDQRCRIDESYVNEFGVSHTLTNVQVLGIPDWYTWQPFGGASDSAGPITTNVNKRDSDEDGLIDGLEDINHNGVFGDIAQAGSTCYIKPGATCLSELDAKLKDTDGDGIVDGRELMVWGAYSFREAVTQWGGSFTQLAFDAGNPFETDPRSKHTDRYAVPGFEDLVPDGSDILPRGDGLLQLKLGSYRTDDKIDCKGAFCTGDGSWAVDLMLQFELTTPVGGYSVRTVPISEWDTKEEKEFSDLSDTVLQNLIDETVPLAKPTSAARQTFMDIVLDEPYVNFDLPDYYDVEHGGWMQTTKVVLDILGKDDDGNGWDGNDADTIDLSEDAGVRKYSSVPKHDYDLSKGLIEPHRTKPMSLTANGNADGEDQVKEDDGVLKVELGNNLMPYFFGPLLDRKPGELIGPPSNALDCFGGLTKQGGSCVG